MEQMHPQGVQRWAAVLAMCGWALASWPAVAQDVPEPANADPAALERAKRDAEKVFKWILIHADKPKKAAEQKPAPPPSAAPTAAAVRAPARPKAAEDSGIVERVTPIPAPPQAVVAQRPASAASSPAVAAQPVAPAPQLAEATPSQPATAASEPALVALAAPASASRSLPVPPIPAEEEDEEQPLVLTTQVEPDFPPSVMRRLVKGSVHVRFEVKPDGSVGQTSVVKTSSARLNEAALDAVAKWRFQPLRRAQTGVVELAFNLE